MDPTFGGVFAFGTACNVMHTPIPDASQKDSFFGISGLVSLWGGNRGRTFHIRGVFFGADPASVIAAENLLLSYADGIARDFTDTQGRLFSNVLFEGVYRAHPEGPRPASDQGWVLPFQCELIGLA